MAMYVSNTSSISYNSKFSQPNSSTASTMNSNQPKTFANAAKTINYPNKDQAIVINTVPEIPIEEYVYKIGDLIGANNITHQSKIYNSRICIFLSKKELVDKIVNENSIVTINNQQIEIRRYINSAQRVIISNVCPSIPNSLIEAAFIEHDIKTVSPITFLRSGLMKEEYKHILSFRRQFFMPPNEDKPLPESLTIYYDDTKYKIYLTSDITCFHCKQKGHTANKCPMKNNVIPADESANTSNKNNNIQVSPSQQSNPNIQVLPSQQLNPNNNPTTGDNLSTQQDKEEKLKSNNRAKQEQEIKEFLESLNTTAQTSTQNDMSQQDSMDIIEKSPGVHVIPEGGLSFYTKRPALSTSSLDDDQDDDNIDTSNKVHQTINLEKISTSETTKNKPKQKKPRSESPENISLEVALAPLKKTMKNEPHLYVINFKDLNEIIQKVISADLSEHVPIIRSHTTDLNGIIVTLVRLHKHLTSRSIKNRFTRLINRLKEYESKTNEINN